MLQVTGSYVNLSS